MFKDGIKTDPEKVATLNECPPNCDRSTKFFRFYQLVSEVYTKAHAYNKTYKSTSDET